MKPFLAFSLVMGLGMASAVSTVQDTDRISNSIALSVDGLVRPCPAELKATSPTARCVSSDASVATTRRLISDADLKLYGAWHGETDPNYVYNWILAPTGFVNIIVGPDPQQSSRSVVVVTVPTADTTAAPTFRRTLRLASPRMNGEEVRSLQNRLMDVSRIKRGKGADGWYGPVTEATVLVFQRANGLPATGVVDPTTWNTLFSSKARYFDANLARAIAQGRK